MNAGFKLARVTRHEQQELFGKWITSTLVKEMGDIML